MNEKYFREYILEETGRIKNFQNKLENNEVREDRIYSVKRKIDAIQFELLIARYSSGEDIEKLENDFIQLLNDMPLYWNGNSSYIDMLWMMALAILFDVSREKFGILSDLVTQYNRKDALLEFFVNYKMNGNIGQLKGDYSFGFPYDKLTDIVANREKTVEKLKEYLIKGYNLNVERFKNNGNDPYFDELLDKIRDIRSSEKVFWRKILDIYATSVDYNPKKEITINFFKTVQNKMHYAVSSNTAAEIVYNRVDSKKDNIGLTNFKGDMPTRKETKIAKNYLSYEELQILNRLVSAYLDIAEINALKRKTMTMQDWVHELDSFLKMTHNDILHTKGTVSHEEALKKAHEEYDKYMQKHLTRAEKDYLEIMNIEVKEIEKNN